MNNPYPSVFIEKYLPLELLNQQVYYEHGRNPFKGLHRWYSRKPLSLSRASVLASILPSDITSEEFEILLGMDDNVRLYKTPPSNDIIEKVKDYCEKTWGIRSPTVLDAFGGGGSIPFEAARYKLNVLASDLNPVAVLTMKAAIEYPLKFGPELQQHIDKWVEWVGVEAEKRLSQFFPSLPGESIQNYLWVHTVKCPSCSTEVPLSPNWWLYKRPEKQNHHKWTAVKPVPNPKNKKVDFELIKGHKGNGNTIKLDNIEFDPSDYNTIKRGLGRCPNCGSKIKDNIIKAQAKSEGLGHQLYAVAFRKNGDSLEFRLPEKIDFEGWQKSKDYLSSKLVELKEKCLVPDVKLPYMHLSHEKFTELLESRVNPGDKTNEAINNGINKWTDMFNSRQLLTLITYTDIIQEVKELLRKDYSYDEVEAIATYLTLVLDRCVDKNSRLSHWNSSTGSVKQSAAHHSLNMFWNYPETEAKDLWGNCLKDVTKDYTKLCELLKAEIQLGEMPNQILNYGINKWTDMFNSRQLLTLITYTEIIQEVKELLRKEYSDDEVEAIATYLTLVLDRCVDGNSRLSRFQSSRACTQQASSHHALNLNWNYPETEAKNLWGNCLKDVTKDYTKLCELLKAEIQPGEMPNQILNYGINKWTDMFNSRQLLTLITYTEIIQEVKELLRKDYSEDEVKAIATYLTLVLDRCVDKNSRLSHLNSSTGSVDQSAAHHSLNMFWSYPETEAKDLWDNCLKDVTKDYTKLNNILQSYTQKIKSNNIIDIRSASADNLTHIPDKSVEVIVTDPPYYDTIQYAELSDFFYVWQRAVLSDIFPDLYQKYLTEKDKEVVANASRFKNKKANAKELARIDYEHKLLNVFKEHNRVLRDDGVMTIQFNHKNIDAWDCLSRSLIDAGFTVTASWEVVTENPQSLHQRNKKSISSTILLVCRKRLSTEATAWESIRPLIIESISSELVLTEKNKLNIEDFHSKLFGLALKKFSMYDKVLDDKGDTVRPKAVFLEVIAAIASLQ